jgi:hypothetical protein
MWHWERMEKIVCINHLRNEEALHKVQEGMNILHTIKNREASRLVHILHSDCLVKHIIEGR